MGTITKTGHILETVGRQVKPEVKQQEQEQQVKPKERNLKVNSEVEQQEQETEVNPEVKPKERDLKVNAEVQILDVLEAKVSFLVMETCFEYDYEANVVVILTFYG